jgi:L-arabinose isomerase
MGGQQTRGRWLSFVESALFCRSLRQYSTPILCEFAFSKLKSMNPGIHQNPRLYLASSLTLRVGLVGMGLEAYWPQFQGLRTRLEEYLSVVAQKIAAPSRTVINLGLVDSVESGMAAAHRCREGDVDILLVYVTTYALSSTLLPLLRRNRVPVILLNLQPTAAINYAEFNEMGDRTAMTGEWLAYCSSCPMPEIANMLTRLCIPFEQVTGILHDDRGCWQEIEQWLIAAHTKHVLEHSRLGLMGHYYTGMLDVATDLLQVSGRFGVDIEMLEVDELSAFRREVSPAEVQARISLFRDFFAVDEDSPSADLAAAAATSVALDRLVDTHRLGLLAYYYKGTGIAENEITLSSIILGTTLLTARGTPVAGEYEEKNVIAMKIMELLGAGGSFTEYYAIDFQRDLVLMGHDGPGHPTIAEGKIKVRRLKTYHGKVGCGLSVEMSVKHGPVTLLSVVEDREHGFKLLAAQGHSVAGQVLEIGNTNSFYQFSVGARGFVDVWNSHGPAHHCAVGTGHLTDQLSKLARLLAIPLVIVC